MSAQSHPVSHPDTSALWRDCPNAAAQASAAEAHRPNAYEALYAKEFADELRSSKIVGIFHANYLKYHPHRKVGMFELEMMGC